MFRKTIHLVLIISFVFSSLMPVPKAHAVLGLPEPGTMVNLSPAFDGVMMKGLVIHPDNPLMFDFIVDTGTGSNLKQEGEKLAKYFLACLTIPEKDLWVNLSPYEKDRMIADDLGQTEMGRDLLAQDYILKQITASLIYPEKELGKEFWNRVYAKAQQMYGSAEIPVNTFNKVWITADRAEVFERNNTAFVTDRHLKVMLEEDYLAQKNGDVHHFSPVSLPNKNGVRPHFSEIIREIILPELEQEVNTGKNFAPLRQIFNTLILASWYKKNLKQALLNQVYSDQAKVKGLSVIASEAKQSPEYIYQQYLAAYKKGVFNYIKEEIPSHSVGRAREGGATIPRKYFSGGWAPGVASNPAMTADTLKLVKALGKRPNLFQITAGANINGALDSAMRVQTKKQLMVFIGETGSTNLPAEEFITLIDDIVGSIRKAGPDALKYFLLRSSHDGIHVIMSELRDSHPELGIVYDSHTHNWKIPEGSVEDARRLLLVEQDKIKKEMLKFKPDAPSPKTKPDSFSAAMTSDGVKDFETAVNALIEPKEGKFAVQFYFEQNPENSPLGGFRYNKKYGHLVFDLWSDIDVVKFMKNLRTVFPSPVSELEWDILTEQAFHLLQPVGGISSSKSLGTTISGISNPLVAASDRIGLTHRILVAKNAMITDEKTIAALVDNTYFKSGLGTGEQQAGDIAIQKISLQILSLLLDAKKLDKTVLNKVLDEKGGFRRVNLKAIPFEAQDSDYEGRIAATIHGVKRELVVRRDMGAYVLDQMERYSASAAMTAATKGVEEPEFLLMDIDFQTVHDIVTKVLERGITLEEQVQLLQELRHYIAGRPDSSYLNDFVKGIFKDALDLFNRFVVFEDKDKARLVDLFIKGFSNAVITRLYPGKPIMVDYLKNNGGERVVAGVLWSEISDIIVEDTIQEIRTSANRAMTSTDLQGIINGAVFVSETKGDKERVITFHSAKQTYALTVTLSPQPVNPELRFVLRRGTEELQNMSTFLVDQFGADFRVLLDKMRRVLQTDETLAQRHDATRFTRSSSTPSPAMMVAVRWAHQQTSDAAMHTVMVITGVVGVIGIAATAAFWAIFPNKHPLADVGDPDDPLKAIIGAHITKSNGKVMIGGYPLDGDYRSKISSWRLETGKIKNTGFVAWSVPKDDGFIKAFTRMFYRATGLVAEDQYKGYIVFSVDDAKAKERINHFLDVMEDVVFSTEAQAEMSGQASEAMTAGTIIMAPNAPITQAFKNILGEIMPNNADVGDLLAPMNEPVDNILRASLLQYAPGVVLRLEKRNGREGGGKTVAMIFVGGKLRDVEKNIIPRLKQKLDKHMHTADKEPTPEEAVDIIASLIKKISVEIKVLPQITDEERNELKGKFIPVPMDVAVWNVPVEDIVLAIRVLKQALVGRTQWKVVRVDGKRVFRLTYANFESLRAILTEKAMDYLLNDISFVAQYSPGVLEAHPRKNALDFKTRRKEGKDMLAWLVRLERGLFTVNARPDQKITITREGVELVSPKSVTKAPVQGGIDLNATGMKTTVRKEGQGVEFTFDAAMVERIKKEGIQSLTPVIFNITPITSIWPIVGLEPPKRQEERLAGV